MKGHRGTQIAASIIKRSTIQNAIVLATALGSHGHWRGPTYRRWASEMMLGSLLPSLIEMKVVELDLQRNYRELAIENYRKRRDERSAKDPIRKSMAEAKDLRVDLVLTPLDGAVALHQGRVGAISGAAVGPVGCFVKEEPGGPDAYFVIVIGQEALSEEMLTKLEKYDSYEIGETQTLDQFLSRYKLIDDAIDVLGHQRIPPVIGMTFEGPYRRWLPKIGPWHRTRRLEGSTVAAALCANLKKMPCACFASRPPQVIQAAIAAKGLHSRLYAIPLREEAGAKNIQDVTVLEGRIRRERDFVTSDNAILCCTSVSEICVLDRVRFGLDHSARVESIEISLATGKVTHQRDEIDLERANMRTPDGTEIVALELICAFKRVLHNEKFTEIADSLKREDR